MGRWVGMRAPAYPYVFSTWLEYPEIFEEVDHEALATFLDHMPPGLGPVTMDEALKAILDVDYPGLRQEGIKPRTWWQVLELSGSAGRYSSLMCQVYPELSVTPNCTVVCQDWQRRPEGLIEHAAAGVYALLSGAREGSKPRIIDGLPDLQSEYDLIIGLRGMVNEDDDRIQRMLAPTGKLVLMDKTPWPAGVIPLR
jgi:hypothetical protein